MNKVSSSETKKPLLCSFCGKSQHEVRKLIAGPTVFICEECVELCMDIVGEENKSSLVKSRDGIPLPKEIRKILDDYVINDQIKKTTVRWELADNLGTHQGVRKWMAGTHYHFNDTYIQIRDRGSLKPRVYPATNDGSMEGKPVFLSLERWQQIKRDQRSTVSAQMLLNPIAGTEATFSRFWLAPYEVYPSLLNVYILIDPSKGKGPRSDRTAMAVIGLDVGGVKYLLDGYCHRMKPSERWANIKALRRKWMGHPGVQIVWIGYEQYGHVDDIGWMQDKMIEERDHFDIWPLDTPETGGHSKLDRVDRLEPYFREGRFLLPCVAHHPDFGGECTWRIWTQQHEEDDIKKGYGNRFSIGQIVFTPTKGKRSKRQQMMLDSDQAYRVLQPLKHRDENDNIYDLTRVFMDEFIR